jgi:hypothetical protein
MKQCDRVSIDATFSLHLGYGLYHVDFERPPHITSIHCSCIFDMRKSVRCTHRNFIHSDTNHLYSITETTTTFNHAGLHDPERGAQQGTFSFKISLSLFSIQLFEMVGSVSWFWFVCHCIFVFEPPDVRVDRTQAKRGQEVYQHAPNHRRLRNEEARCLRPSRLLQVHRQVDEGQASSPGHQPLHQGALRFQG